MQSPSVRSAVLAPPGTRIYVVGGLYGRSDLLDGAIQFIERDSRDAVSRGLSTLAVFLGGYIDRGPDSKGVINRLVELRGSGPSACRFLRGSHEQLLLDLIDGREPTSRWLEFGGLETLASYNVRAQRDAQQLRELVQNALPSAHLDFLRSTELYAEVGDYIFAHAGVRADRPLETQSVADLLWRRYPDDAPAVPGRIVIHGHLPVAAPLVRNGRIGIETNAQATGVLTLLRLEKDRQDFVRIAGGDGPAKISAWRTPAALAEVPSNREWSRPGQDLVPVRQLQTRPVAPVRRKGVAVWSGALGAVALATGLVSVSLFAPPGELKAEGEPAAKALRKTDPSPTLERSASTLKQVASDAPVTTPVNVQSSPEKTDSSAPTGPLVQIAATGSEALGRSLWSDISAKLPGETRGKTLSLQPVQVRDQTLYRAILAGFSTPDEAAAFCQRLRASGYDCLQRK